VHIESISYEVDGIGMTGHLAYDDNRKGTRPGVLLAHEGPGLDPHVKGRAERLATLGYCAFALDYLGAGEPVRDVQRTMERLAPLMADPAVPRRRGLAGLDVLLDQQTSDGDRIACIGYCFGGTVALEIARSGADVQAVVGFHPGLTTSPDSHRIKAPVLMCVGTDDPLLPLEARVAFEQDMKDAGVADWRLDVYGGVGHSFTNRDVDEMGIPGVAYHARADARSWASMLGLFSETIDG
jgi:dienelactone hydrolase